MSPCDPGQRRPRAAPIEQGHPTLSARIAIGATLAKLMANQDIGVDRSGFTVSVLEQDAPALEDPL